MKKNIIYIVLFFGFYFSVYSQVTEQDLNAGKVVILDSKYLKEKRAIYITPPANYKNTNISYPVLFVLDAEGNHFFSSGVAHFFGQLTKVPDLIVVGIPNIDRGRDFTPAVISDYKSGGAEPFIEFIEKELILYVEQNYRTVPFRILFGHSLGGMFNIHCLTKHPDLFQAHIAASPYVKFKNNYVINEAEGKIVKLNDKHRFLFMMLGDEPDYEESLDKLTDLIDDEASEKLHWNFVQLKSEDHGTVKLKTLYQGLEFIFPDWRIEAETIQEGSSAIIQKYGELSDRYGYDIKPDEATLNRVGYIYLNNKMISDAIKILKYNMELYKSSPNTYDSLGEAYEKNSQLELAKENYQKAVKFSKISGLGNLDVFLKNLSRIESRLVSNFEG